MKRALLVLSLVACGSASSLPVPADAQADAMDAGADAHACVDEDGDGHGAMPCGDDCNDLDPNIVACVDGGSR